MGLTNVSGVDAATRAVQNAGGTDAQVQVQVMKKALALQSEGATTLLQALPQMPALATSGSVGTRLHAVA